MTKRILPNGIAVLDGDSHLTKWVEESGRLDHDGMIERLASMIPPGTVAIDAGASIGDHTFGYLKSKASLVVAFEPNPAAYECLVHNCPKAMCLQFALGSYCEIRFFKINSPNYGASYIHDRDLLVESDEVDGSVQVLRLDMFQFPQRVGFIKADVEGFELELLLGAYDTIKRDRPIICMEVNKGRLEANGSSPEQLIHSLHVLGYDTTPVPGTVEHPLQWDVLATPR